MEICAAPCLKPDNVRAVSNALTTTRKPSNNFTKEEGKHLVVKEEKEEARNVGGLQTGREAKT